MLMITYIYIVLMPTVCKGPVDITFVIDGSTSAAYNTNGGFKRTLNLVKEFANNYIIGPQNARFGVVVFASEAQTVFKFESHATKESLLQNIDRIPFPQTISFLGQGLQQAKDVVGIELFVGLLCRRISSSRPFQRIKGDVVNSIGRVL